MPTDLKLDTTSHDLDLISKDPNTGLTNTFKLFQNNLEVVAQRVKIAVLWRLGEWFKDINLGLPYTQKFFVTKNNKVFIDTTIEQYISEVEGVIEVVSYSSNIVNRNLKAVTTLRTTGGLIKDLVLEV